MAIPISPAYEAKKAQERLRASLLSPVFFIDRRDSAATMNGAKRKPASRSFQQKDINNCDYTFTAIFMSWVPNGTVVTWTIGTSTAFVMKKNDASTATAVKNLPKQNVTVTVDTSNSSSARPFQQLMTCVMHLYTVMVS